MLTPDGLATERARMLKALGEPTRLRIFDFLRRRCCAFAVGEGGEVHPLQGPSFGEVCCYVTGKQRVDTTTSFHIRVLEQAGLISVEKRGRFMICAVNDAAVSKLAAYLAAPEPVPCDEECQ